MSYKDSKALRTAKVAGPQQEIKSKNTDLSSSSPSTTQEELPMRMGKIFPFINDTYRDLQRFISGVHKDSISSQLMQTINKYKNGCNEIYAKTLESYDMCYKLAQNVVRTMDIFKELCTCLSDLEEYNYRLCEIMSIYIVWELRLSADATQQEQLLTAHRIIYIMRRHLVQEEENETHYNILRTLVYIPKLFNARYIMCAIFGELIPIKPVPEVKVFPDKLYMMYIIVFYRWMQMQKDEDDKVLLVNFAENYMKPSASLCSNKLYCPYLPIYTTHSTATRTILNNLRCYSDIRNASIIDNAFKKIGTIVNLCDDEDDDIVIVDVSDKTDFAQMFASVRLEPLSGSISNIKLEEKTVIDTVDLTTEEEPVNPVTSIYERHDKWLNVFKMLAQQYRESQLLLQRQQDNRLISSGDKETVITLDSDSEEEEEISAAVGKETPAAETATQQNNSEDLFVDNYPLTNTPLNCDFELESLDDEDENDVTKISSRFLPGNLRTYPAKRSNLFETEDKNNSGADEQSKAQNVDQIRRDSLHISSTPPEETQNEEDDGTDVQDEHDDLLDEEAEFHAYSFLPASSKKPDNEKLPKQIRPMGPYPTYNNMHNNKVVFSQATSRYPQLQQQQQQHKDKDKQYYYSDSSVTKSPKKQKKRVQFNTNPQGPSASSSSRKVSLKPALQQKKYKASDAPEYYNLRGFERFSRSRSIEDVASVLGSASTASSTKQQEPTNAKCINQQNFNVKNYNHNNKCSNLYKNLSVFKQTFSNFNIKQKSMKNIKINLKKIRLDKDISLTNFKSNFSSKEEPHTTTTLTLIENNSSNHNSNNSTCAQTESCLNISTSHNNDDDKIFKKPLPVTKKVFKSPKPLKIQKVVSLRRHPYYFKRRDSIKAEPVEGLAILQKPILMNEDGNKQLNLLDEKQVSAIEKDINPESANNSDVVENEMNLESVTTDLVNHSDADDLSNISKLLTDEINSLTCEIDKRNEKKETTTGELHSDNLANSSDDSTPCKKDETYSNKLENIETIEHQYINSVLQAEIPEEHSSKLKDEKETLSYSASEDNFSNLNGEKINLSNSLDETANAILKGNKKDIEIYGNENRQKLIANEVESTKDGNISDLTENKDSNSEDDSVFEDMQTSTLEKTYESDVKSAGTTQNSSKPVTNFSAEFLAGLPNEPSPSPTDSAESECVGKNYIDFEFENNCSTPTMCRIDLDEMSENTSDVPAATSLHIEECEADKLLEDFNNKTQHIVGSTLNKNAINVSEAGYSTDSPKVSISKNILPTVFTKNIVALPVQEEEYNNASLSVNTGKETLKRPREKDIVSVEEEPLKKFMKKANSVSINNECSNMSGENIINSSSTDVGPTEEDTQLLNKLKIVTSINNIGKIDAKNIALDCDQNKESLKANKQSNGLTESTTKNFSNQEQKTKQPTSSKKLNKQSRTLHRNQPHTKENIEETIKSRSDDSCDIEENEVNNCAKIEQTAKDEIAPAQRETPFNENQHMTVKLDEIKTKDSEAGSVSAIFSFPKIPIISISIHTTPNNKTYFKISNRENDNQTKDGGKTKKIKSSQPESEGETTNEKETTTNHENDNPIKDGCKTNILHSPQANNEVKITNEERTETNRENENQIKDDGKTVKVNSPQTDVEGKTTNEEETVTSSILESNEITNKEICQPAMDYNEEDDEEFQREEEEDEETDNFEIEKFSHDSNSACSLPLKKRPTQAEPNDDTEDSQAIVSASYEQPQEIAAEVVIGNNCKNKTLYSNALQTDDDYDTDEFLNVLTDFDDNKPSTSSACFKKLLDASSPFKRRVHAPMRAMGLTPIQIVAPQLKGNTPSPSQDHRSSDTQVPSVSRMGTQSIQTLPESYPATPMLSVANVEKLMDFNRFTEDLLASPDVMTIIDNANACGYYAEGQAYEMERIAILEHYNIANAKGNTSATKPLYWKKSAGDTISIFNDNDNEWISLPPSTAKQLQKLSFVLSILQQQYKVTDVRQRINIALTFLIRNTSKFKNTSLLQQRMPSLYSRNITDLNTSNHNMSQSLPSTSYFRIATNNEMVNTNFNMNSNMETVQDFHSTNYSNNQQQPEMTLQQETTANQNSNQNWSSSMHFASSGTAQVIDQTNTLNSPQRFSSNNIECEQQQLTQTPDKRSSCIDELNNDQLYINPPCATSPQNEVIVNTNGVELHEVPQDQQNIFISITDESVTANGGAESSSMHKYNTRQQQQQQQQQQFRTLEDVEVSPSSSSITQQSYAKRTCGGSLIPTHFMRNNIIPTFGNQEINLQNPYRMQQQQMTTQNLNTSPSPNFPQRNITQKSSPINSYNNNNNNNNSSSSSRYSTHLDQQQQKPQQRMCTRFNSSFNTQLPVSSLQTESKSKDSNYKDILQPYITYLIKDHEKTSKHLLQVFEEVSNSNAPNGPVDNNLHAHQQLFNSLMPPLIRNPQQNHMPGFHQMTTGASCASILPSLIRNPHDNSLVNRNSGALQLVQSFLEQSQTTFDAAQQQQATPSSLFNPGFANEYINFVGSRDELLQKYNLRNLNKEQHELQQQQQQEQQQLNEQFVMQQQQEAQRLNSVKRKCQERNDKLAEDLKYKMMEFSLLKHNVQAKQLEKQHTQQEVEIKPIENCTMTTKRRGRPKKIISKLPLENNVCSARVTRRRQTNNDLSTATTIDHAYFRQRSAAREAAKRINATINSSFH